LDFVVVQSPPFPSRRTILYIITRSSFRRTTRRHRRSSCFFFIRADLVVTFCGPDGMFCPCRLFLFRFDVPSEGLTMLF
jgi:hypothetical protein